MKNILATVAMAVIFNSAVSFATTELVELKPFEQVQMDVYLIRASNVSSVDVLVDYEMIDVDCHGLDKSYTSVVNAVTNEIFVTTKYNNQLHNSCVLPIMTKAQDGLKLTLMSAVGTHSVTQTLFVPVCSKVKVLLNKLSQAQAETYECLVDDGGGLKKGSTYRLELSNDGENAQNSYLVKSPAKAYQLKYKDGNYVPLTGETFALRGELDADLSVVNLEQVSLKFKKGECMKFRGVMSFDLKNSLWTRSVGGIQNPKMPESQCPQLSSQKPTTHKMSCTLVSN